MGCIRVQPQQKKPPTRPPLLTALGFDANEDDNVKRDILRQAYKNKSHKDIEEQHKKALEEDPSVFYYDGVYDKMKEKEVRPIEQDRQDGKPRYIQALTDKAKQQEKEHEISYERKLAKERSKDEHLYADKDKFVNSTYNKKLAEQGKWLEEERLREMREVMKKMDLSDFSFNAREDDLWKPEKQPEELVVQSPEQVSPPPTGISSESCRLGKRHQDETAMSLSPKEKSDLAYGKPMSDASTQDQTFNKPSYSGQQRPDHHKRSEDAGAAAKERFLARKIQRGNELIC